MLYETLSEQKVGYSIICYNIPMIPLNQEQYLGKKAFYLHALKNLAPGLIMLVLAIAVLLLKTQVTSLVLFVYKSFGFSGLDAARYTDQSFIYIAIALAGFAVLIMLTGISTARLNYRNFSFTFEEFGMRMKKGIVKIIEVTIPYRQMTNVEIERSLWHQIFGTSKIIINTASNEVDDEKNETDIVLDPINKELAEEIRLTLQRKIGIQVVESDVKADREAAEQNTISKPQ